MFEKLEIYLKNFKQIQKAIKLYKTDIFNEEKIDISNAEKFIASSKSGASIYLVGTVRDLNNEKKVTGITYDSHDALVIKSFEEIYKESQGKFKFENSAVFIEHVKGHVKLGETSIIIAVACKHRAQAYDFSRFIIEEIKKRTPIWKKEHYENKDSEWLKGNPIKSTQKNLFLYLDQLLQILN